MEGAICVKIFQAQDNAGDKEAGLFLRKQASPTHVKSQVAPSEQVHHQVQVLPILEGELHIHNKSEFLRVLRMFELSE